MKEEIKITSKSIWPLIKSNIGTLIIIGGLVTNALLINGKKAVDKYKTGLGNDSLIQNQVEMKSDIKSIQGAVSLQNQHWTEFTNELKELKQNMVESKNAYNGLRTVVLDHTKKSPGMTLDEFKNYMETAPELKKNDLYNWNPQIPPWDTTNIPLGMSNLNQ